MEKESKIRLFPVVGWRFFCWKVALRTKLSEYAALTLTLRGSHSSVFRFFRRCKGVVFWPNITLWCIMERIYFITNPKGISSLENVSNYFNVALYVDINLKTNSHPTVIFEDQATKGQTSKQYVIFETINFSLFSKT